MKKFGVVDLCKVLCFLSVLALSALSFSGCATAGGSDDDNGSDLPWNTPQSWEGSPSIPGLDGMSGY